MFGACLLMAWSASGKMVAHCQPPSYAKLSAGAQGYHGVQGTVFRFTLGGGDDNPAVARTLEKIPLADRGLTSCYVGEWGYSFHHLKNGQVDGAGHKHYGGYPTPPRDRAAAMDVVRRYYLRLRDEALAMATPEQRGCFVSINGHYCYQHYACEWGCDVVGSEVGENINSIQAHIAFTRGAARQYGKPWLMDFSSWYGPSIFDEDPHRTWGDNSGPTNGHSLSLHARSYLVSYMAGANIMVAEGGSLNAFRGQQPQSDGTLPLSSLGVEMARFYRFTRRHPDRGVPYAPIGLLLPFDHGIYPGFGPKRTWDAFPYTRGDQSVLDALNCFWPGSLGDPDQPERPDRQPGNPSWSDPDYMHTEALRLVAAPYGDVADVLLSNAPANVLAAYPVMVLVGDFKPSSVLTARLCDYVARGGTLIVDESEVRSGVLPGDMFERLVIPVRDDYSRVRYGKGAVVVVAHTRRVQPTAERPVAKAVARAVRELIPFSVTGRMETLLNRTADGWIVTLVNNEGVTKTFFDPPRINANAAQTVKITYHGTGTVRRADLWGADGDEELSPTAITVTVPPGEVRVIKLRL